MKTLKILPLIMALVIMCSCGSSGVAGGFDQPVSSDLPQQNEEVPPPAEEEFPEIIIDEPPVPPDTTVKLSIVGDVLIHNTLISKAYDAERDYYDFSPNFQYVKHHFEDSDVVITQIEGALAGSDWAYSGYPSFNTPEDILDALKDMGVNLITLAGNHALDFGWKGLNSTYNFLEEAGIDHVGTYLSREERDATNGVLLKEVKGVKIAFLSYTYGTNGIPTPDGKDWCVNILYNDYLTYFTDLNADAIIADLQAAKDMEPDLIVAITHWGTEYQTVQNGYQEAAAKVFLENGADIVFGGHPHVLQPMVMRSVTTVDGEEKEAFVSFSLGNFVSGQYYDYTNLSAILSVEVTKSG